MKSKTVFYLKFLVLAIVIILANITSPAVSAKEIESGNKISAIEQSYQQGVRKGIINDSNMSYGDYFAVCKYSMFPYWLKNVASTSNKSFEEFMSEDNYEVPKSADLNVTTVVVHVAKSYGKAYSKKRAHSSYHMKTGDIFICYGKNFNGTFIGHAAMALSNSKIIHMPGTGKRAQVWTKKHFFKSNTGGKSHAYVAVYRIKKHPHLAKKAVLYSYRKMYKTHNPKYGITTHVFHKSPSYCSKYVYLAYWWGVSHKTVKDVGNFHILHPHSFLGDFKGSFSPKYLYKIYKY